MLGLTEESAFSWGLNRAIFYAAAKKGFKGKTERPVGFGKEETGKNVYLLGDEKAYTDKNRSKKEDKPYFAIGEKTQTVGDFRKQIGSRFGNDRNFRRAWAEALKIVGSYDEDVLKSQKDFYALIYKPRRDQLSKT